MEQRVAERFLGGVLGIGALVQESERQPKGLVAWVLVVPLGDPCVALSPYPPTTDSSPDGNKA
ncbi:MAG: hypothetical protein AAFX99_20995, partial [Myxococcota bacterium]